MSQSVTISDIAKAVGVSHPVVSKVINGGKSSNIRVSEKRRREIVDVAKRLGYRTNVAARAMKTGKHHAFGYLSSQDAKNSSLPPELNWGLQQRLGDCDLHLVSGQVRDEVLGDRSSLPKLLREWVVDGLLISHRFEPPRALIDAIEHIGLPAVWLNIKRSFDAVRLNDFQGGRIATEALLKVGHKRIAFVLPCAESEIDSHHYSLRDRVGAYEETMRAAGLVPRYLPFDCGLDSALGYQKIRHTLEDQNRPTALLSHVGHNYWTADFWMLLAAVCYDLDIRIPEQLALMGFQYHRINIARGEAARCRMLWPKLASEAVDMVIEKVAQGNEPLPERLVDFDIIPGDTLVPPSVS